MVFDYIYKNTSDTSAKIYTNKEVFDKLQISSKTIEAMRKRAILKSALYSARIEGNTLTWSEVEFMLEEIEIEEGETVEDTLLPRRAEILAIIRKHRMMMFDQIRSRFLMTNPRTLHYDLQDLLKKNLIRKLGTIRGVVYVPR